ncbi:TPA: DEAD/DEAH box helicase family protein [Citrobacter freundii]|uniref:DEAD/DEAH box helicase family protein n=1 Tax=Enterobacteriaceae TaxID=543 RepID=UPI0008F916E5|nr:MULTISPECIES: DEAD/DEAH box helicase family protein [Enterobacteriaceae]AWS99296.1 hypothetical protein AN232_29760 [Citrobacter sp. CRE-46]MCO4108389.1 hypothetical protein [Citrobacter freundii]MDK3490769.1 hypothetical protein [Escherichia coli]OIK44304.1 hypothetical protein BED30_25310 [Citrobacter portucalensis]OIZ41169.1 hypothetical protein BEH71_18070 [Citrobacter freundii]
MESRKNNVMVVGKTGSGKTAISAEVMRTFLSERQRDDWRELRAGIQKNEKNSGDEHHENQQ